MFLGRIGVTVKDAAGSPLPGVRLTLNAAMDAVRTSDPQGDAHFLNLPVDTYTLTATHTGFTSATEKVIVVAGAETRVVLTLRPTAASQEAGAAAATVLVDAGRSTITTRVMPQEFQDVPSPRDVWAWLPTIATVYGDRVNVGGSESGHQSAFTAKGAQAGDNLWSLDGVPVTDMATAGASPLFYDVDGLAEMAVTTGGADARNATGGVQSQMLLKSGGAAPHGGVHYYYYPDTVMSKSVAMPPTDIIECVVVTPEATLRDDTAQFVVLPLVDGEIGIAPFHSPMIGRLGCGEMRITEEGGGRILRYFIDGGFVQVNGNIVYVMTQRAIEADKIDPAAAEQQLRRRNRAALGRRRRAGLPSASSTSCVPAPVSASPGTRIDVSPSGRGVTCSDRIVEHVCRMSLRLRPGCGASASRARPWSAARRCA